MRLFLDRRVGVLGRGAARLREGADHDQLGRDLGPVCIEQDLRKPAPACVGIDPHMVHVGAVVLHGVGESCQRVAHSSEADEDSARLHTSVIAAFREDELPFLRTDGVEQVT